ncbi:MAG: HAMP domain-containing protein [Candidatus Solibacter usitatus]|nr:HAMP domain-containing protein [Candidatus Solibacter usitatus]
MRRKRGPTSLFRGLRFRLTITNAIFLIGLLVALGFFFRGVLSRILETQMREVLEEEWGAAKSYLVIHRRTVDWQWDHTDPEETAAVQRIQLVFFVADAGGRKLASSPVYDSLGRHTPEEIQRVLTKKEQLWQIRTTSDGEPYQVRGGIFIDDNDQTFFVAIGRSLADNRSTLRIFTKDYFSLLPILILSGSLLGWFMSGRAISPVHELAETAGLISSTNLSLRIPRRGSGDELDHLIDTFNNMMERLEQGFRMTRQFSTDVSHELRTPLTAIRGQIEVALFTAQTKEQYREAMLNALEDVERLSRTIRAMLLLSQAESGQLVLQKETFDLCDVAEDFVGQFQIPAEEAHLKISQELTRPAWVEADRVQIDRLISNLLTNSLKYTAAGGTVVVRVRPGEDSVVLEVEDSGSGIEREYLPHIFDRFYRVPGSSKDKQGLGLGLSFVAWIVKAHDGTIDVQSEKGRGTLFHITLPEAAPAVAVIPVAESPAVAD